MKSPSFALGFWYNLVYPLNMIVPEFHEFNMRVPSLERLLEDIHVTWAHLEKKRTRLQLYTEVVSRIAHRAWRRHRSKQTWWYRVESDPLTRADAELYSSVL
ncbi:hypothetical protein Tco_0287011 [Tanacetum coccineum]